MGRKMFGSEWWRTLRQVAIAFAVVVAVPAVALADGGTAIAGAPELPLGKQVTGAVSRPDFWRVPIAQGDTLTIDYEPVGMNGQEIRLCFLPPSVTDFTLRDAECIDRLETDKSDRKRQTAHTFTLPGRYTVVVQHEWCSDYGRHVDIKCTRVVGYSLTAYVVRRTTTTLVQVPKLAKRGSRLTVAGRVNGATSGSVVLQERAGGRWVNKALGKLRTGTFSIKVGLPTAGSFRYRVLYPGDSSHKASSAGFGITVV